MMLRELKPGARFLAVMVLAATLWIRPIPITAQESGGDAEEDPRERLEEISEEKAVLEQELSEMRHAETLAYDELEEIDRDLTYISGRLQRTTGDLERRRDQVENLNRIHARAVGDLEAAQEKFEDRLVEWYKADAGTMLGSLITTGDLSDFLFAVQYTEAIIENDNETIGFIREQQSRIFEQREQLGAEIAECERLLAEMRAQEQQYSDLRERRYARLSELASDVGQVERVLAELDASSYEIAMMLQASRYTGGSAASALIKPIDYAITSGFGMRLHPILGRVRMHDGVDMPAPARTPIHAAGSGLVVYSGWKRGYGYTIIVDHGSGLATLYAHCSALLVSVGETVARGQVIARVGTTGLSTGNHLHFEVRINGEPVDPQYYI